MSDNPAKRGKADRSRIAMTQPHEVRYWTKTLGVKKATLAEAVKAIGDRSIFVRVWLANHMLRAK